MPILSTLQPVSLEQLKEEVDIHDLSIRQRIDWLVGFSRRHSQEFQSPEAWLARSRYLAQHPTAIAAFMCMDGRINIPVATNTPRGIIFPFRNLGGRFNLGWPHLSEVMAEHVQSMVRQGRRTLALITYHYSKNHPHRGCAGFNYDTVAARTYSLGIKHQMGPSSVLVMTRCIRSYVDLRPTKTP